MSTTTTLDPPPTTTEFSFPLRNDVESSPASLRNRSPARASHSRQYTVGYDVPADLVDYSTPSKEFPWTSLTPPPQKPHTKTPSRSPHRRHAHKRSGAVSQHDINLLDLPGKTALGPPLNAQPSPSASPALTFASSTSSLPLSTITNGTAEQSAPSPPRNTKVSFADSPVQRENPSPRPRPHSQVSIESAPETPTSACSSPRRRKHRHKKVGSWAGWFRKGFKKHSKEPFYSQEEEVVLHSSSYIPALNLINVEQEPVEPIIDLDDATAVSETPRRHRRSESAPEFMPPFTGAPRMKRRVEEIVEEEEEEENGPAIEAAAASSSTVSLHSTASSSMYNKDRGRYVRNYNSGILALNMLKQQQQQQEQLQKEKEEEIDSSSDDDPDSPATPTPAQLGPESPATPAIAVANDPNDNDEAVDPLSQSSQKRMSVAGTITEGKRGSVLSTGTVTPPVEQFPFGEPGPEVRFDPFKGRSASVSVDVHKSFFRLRHGSSTNSLDFQKLKRRSLHTRMWGWMRNKVSSGQLQ